MSHAPIAKNPVIIGFSNCNKLTFAVGVFSAIMYGGKKISDALGMDTNATNSTGLNALGQNNDVGETLAVADVGETLAVASGLDTRTAALIVAAPAVGVLGSRAIAGALGLGAKGISKAANLAGKDQLEQQFNQIGDKLISFAKRKESTDLKAAAALTAAAAVTTFVAHRLLILAGI